MKRLILVLCIALLVALIIVSIYQKIDGNQSQNIVVEQIGIIATYIK